MARPKSTPDNPTKEARRYAREAKVAERRASVLGMRKQGMTWQDIATHEKVSVQRAHEIGMEALRELKNEAAPEALALDLARIDEIIASNWEMTLAGDARAADMVLKAIDRRARYLGLDAPTKLAGADGGAVQVETTVKADESFAGFIGLLDKLAADKAQSAGTAGPVAGKGPTEPDTA